MWPERQHELIERDDELAAVRHLAVGLGGGVGGLVVIEGPPGIGKSRLADAAADHAVQAGVDVLRAHGSELESAFPFGVALQLLEPALRHLSAAARDEVLSGAARLARPLLADGAADAGTSSDFSLLHGLTWCVANLGERRPIMLVVDDGQWSDVPSLRWLAYLAQRIDELPVGLVVAARSGEPQAPADLLAGLAGHRLARRLTPRPLSTAAVGALAARTLAAPVAPSFAAACARATRGNPYLLTELLRLARAEAVDPDERGAARIGTFVPEAVLDQLAMRLARLPADAAQLARAVAVLGDDAHLRRAARLAQVDAGAAAAAADALVVADVLTSDDPLRFRHPLVAASVYESIPDQARAVAHRRAAQLLQEEAAAVDRVASHLLRAPREGRAWVVDALTQAADHARALAAPGEAARLLRRALEEPPAPDRRAATLIALGRAETLAAAPAAPERFAQAARLVADPAQRAAALHEQGLGLYQRGAFAAARRAYADALAVLPASDAPAAAAIRADDLMATLLEGGGAERVAIAAYELMARDAGSLSLSERKLLATVALTLTITVGATREQTLAVARQALGGHALLEAEGADGAALYAATGVLVAADAFAEEERLLDAAVQDARRRGSPLGFATAVYARTWPRLFAGDLSGAVDDAERALAARRDGWGVYAGAAYAALIAAHLDRDELDLAAARADEATAQLGPPEGISWAPLLVARGHVHLAQGRAEQALADFEQSGQLAGDNLLPLILNEWRSCTGMLRTRRGDPSGRSLIEEELGYARRYGSARSTAVALRRLAVIEPREAELARLEEAVAVLEGSEARVERARCLVGFGAALRRANKRREAGGVLGDGLELARACGARAIERRALEELEVAGAVARRRAGRGVDALTPAEARVATLAAEGLTNREIAEQLFVTRKAVEYHLGNVYGKLQITSRASLAQALHAPAR
jgi:DNA-binding CsgD family transcriptional regulator